MLKSDFHRPRDPRTLKLGKKTLWLSVVLWGVLSLPSCFAQINMKESRSTRTVSALFISDVHFDPFQDPGKVERLASTPVYSWATILNTPASSGQEVEFAKVRERCGPLVVDSASSLMASALEAGR